MYLGYPGPCSHYVWDLANGCALGAQSKSRRWWSFCRGTNDFQCRNLSGRWLYKRDLLDGSVSGGKNIRGHSAGFQFTVFCCLDELRRSKHPDCPATKEQPWETMRWPPSFSYDKNTRLIKTSFWTSAFAEALAGTDTAFDKDLRPKLMHKGRSDWEFYFKKHPELQNWNIKINCK